MRFLRTMLMVLAALPLSACALTGEAVKGRVLEEGTNKPVPGAIVVVRWKGRVSSFVDSQGVCYHVETATTDEQGNYHTGEWSQKQDYTVKFDYIAVDAYKPGYGLPRQPSRTNELRYLAPFKGTREERLAYLIRMARSSSCNEAGPSEKNLYPLYEALYYGAKMQVVTEADQKNLQWLREIAGGIAVGLSDKFSHAENEKRVEQFLLEHLK